MRKSGNWLPIVVGGILAATSGARGDDACDLGSAFVFSYQGELTCRNGANPQQVCHLVFRLYDAATSGNCLACIDRGENNDCAECQATCAGPCIPNAAPEVGEISVPGGLFSAQLSFGSGAFNGSEKRWLEIEVMGCDHPRNSKCDPGPLSPRYPILPVPLATFACDGGGGGGVQSIAPTCGLTGGGSGPIVPLGVLTTDGLECIPAGVQIRNGGVTHQKLALDYESLFNVSGGAMTATAAGNVGVGTTAPAGHVHIAGGPPWTSHSWNKCLALSGNSAIELGQDNPSTRFGVASANDKFYMFSTSTEGTDQPPSYRMVIDGDGNVGIGTTTPNARLDVNGKATMTGFQLTTSPTNSYVLTSDASGMGTWQPVPIPPCCTNDWHITGNAGTNAGVNFLGTTDNADLVLATFNTARVTVTAGGNVGIGTPGPSERLTVAGGRIYPSGVGSGSGIQFSHLALFEDTDSTLKLTSAGGYNFAFLNGGNVGIGTALPTAKLEVAAAAGTPSIVTTGGRDLAVPTGENLSFGHWDAGSSTHTENMRINGSGNVGIGTPAPDAAARLHVQSSNNPIAFFDGSTSGNQYVQVANTAGSMNLGVGASGTTNGDAYVYSSSGDFFIGADNDPAVVVRGMSGATVGSGFVGIGTASPSAKLHVKASVTDPGAGIGPVVRFQNTLDDSDADLLELRIDHGPAGGGNDFIAFRDTTGLIGSIQGVGSCLCSRANVGNDACTSACAAKIVFNASSGDYAEWLPRLNPEETFTSGDIVALVGGRITKRTTDADLLMAVSEAPIVLGNRPKKEDEHLYEKIAFLGQVPLKVRGSVRAGDYIIPSGSNDGTGVAVSASAIEAAQWPLVLGQAWESSAEPGVKHVNSMVGATPGQQVSGRIAERLNEQTKRIGELEVRLATLERSAGVAHASVPGIGTLWQVGPIVATAVIVSWITARTRRGEEGRT